MRTIKLKSLSLVNFKGIRSLNIGFSDAETLVAGENGTGKTTVFDSFLWLLFGKDSTGRSDSNFNIKTLDSDGKPILHLEHSVTGVLSVDGKTVTLQRCYVENWVKPRGTTEESLKNHATEFYLNGVKLATKKEYDSEVAAIIPEDVFRMITNPFYFTSMKPEAQKEILLDMVGTLTDQDVAQTKPEYLELLAQLSGRSIAQYAKEVAAKKKACKDELSVIPSQIETARKLMPEEEDWVAIDSEIEDKNARIQQIEEQIADKSKLNEQEYQRKAFIQKQIGEKRLQLNSRMNEIATEANKGRNEASLKLNELEYSLRTEKASLDRKRQSVADMDIEIEKLFTIPRSMMPEALPCDAVFGETTIEGLFKSPIQIAGVLGDSHGALTGQMCFEAGMGKVTYGTGSSVMVNIGEEAVAAPEGLVTSVGFSALGKVYYAFEGNIHCTGATIKWMVEKLGLVDSFNQIETLATSVKNNDGVYLVPAFTGLGAPWWKPDAKAAIWGMTLNAGKAHVLRAGLESIAYQVKDLIDMMTRQAGIELKALRVDGGPTKNQFLMQFQADMLHAVINRSEIEEASALGAVVMNGFARKKWASFQEAAAMRTIDNCIAPCMEEKELQSLYSGWREAVKKVIGQNN